MGKQICPSTALRIRHEIQPLVTALYANQPCACSSALVCYY